MKNRMVIGAVAVLLFLATVVDSASKVVSILADGVFAAVALGVIWWAWGRKATPEPVKPTGLQRARLDYAADDDDSLTIPPMDPPATAQAKSARRLFTGKGHGRVT